jgi:cyclophilin family peptidyl-prolyl cis-trans isomerase
MRRSPALHLLLLLALALALAACGGGDDKAEATATPEPAAAAAEPAPGCKKEAPPDPKGEQEIAKPTAKLDPAKKYVATVTTNCGAFEITLDVKRAPKTAASVAHLIREGFYDGTIFHRIVPGFVIQGGDPLGNGQGGPGYSVEEAPPSDLQYLRGIVAMAKTGAEPSGTSGSQFFVVTGEDAGLPPDYALVGRVTAGQDVVDTIGTVETDPATEAPVDPVVMQSVTLAEG